MSIMYVHKAGRCTTICNDLQAKVQHIQQHNCFTFRDRFRTVSDALQHFPLLKGVLAYLVPVGNLI